MKFLRYILSHGLLILFLAALALAYAYRAQLFPEKANTQIDFYVNTSLAWVGLHPRDESSSQVTNTTEQKTLPGHQEETASEQTADDPEENVAAGEKNEPTPSHAEPEEQPATEDIIPSLPVAEADTDSVDTEKNETKDDGVEGEVTDQSVAKTAQADLLDQARLAYQNRKPEQSIKIYKELSILNPDNPDAYGEMGNVLYSQGKWRQAGRAFYKAANCLIAQGKTQQVPYLYRVIQGLDPESAEKLQNKLHR